MLVGSPPHWTIEQAHITCNYICYNSISFAFAQCIRCVRSIHWRSVEQTDQIRSHQIRNENIAFGESRMKRCARDCNRKMCVEYPWAKSNHARARETDAHAHRMHRYGIVKCLGHSFCWSLSNFSIQLLYCSYTIPILYVSLLCVLRVHNHYRHTHTHTQTRTQKWIHEHSVYRSWSCSCKHIERSQPYTQQ